MKLLLVITVYLFSLSACTRHHILSIEKDPGYDRRATMNKQLIEMLKGRPDRINVIPSWSRYKRHTP